MTWPIKVSSYDSTASKASTAIGEITLTNVGTTPQTVTVFLEDEYMGTDVFLSNPSVSGWTANVNDPTHWFQRYESVPRSTHQMAATLPANSSSTLGFQVAFNWSPSVGTSSYSYDTYPTATGFPFALPGPCTTNCFTGAGMSYKVRLRFVVEEDRGALIGAVYLRANLWPDPKQNTESINQALNGGRPF